MARIFNAVIGKICRKDVREEILNRLLEQGNFAFPLNFIFEPYHFLFSALKAVLPADSGKP